MVSLEEVGPERFVVRVRAGADRSDLARHETQVLQLVDDRAAGGSAPVDVLRQAAGASDQWLRTFGGAVVRDAEAQGLVRRGLSRGERIALIVLGVVLGIGAPLHDRQPGWRRQQRGMVRRGADRVGGGRDGARACAHGAPHARW